MKKNILLCIVTAFLLISCKDNSQNTTKTEDSELNETTAAVSSEEIQPTTSADCKEAESLVFEGETFKSYTEDTMRGQGVLSFTMNINDRLTILNEDDTNFGEIVLNEDMTFFTLTMPKKVVARKVIPNYDFAAFDFDAENINTHKDYLFIYVNKEKKKVKKADLKFSFSTWENYIKKQPVQLKTCNLLKDSKGKNLIFDVIEINGDEIKIKSTKDCAGEDAPFENVEGSIKWKSANKLLIDFDSCN
jgi:hypothetical protein